MVVESEAQLVPNSAVTNTILRWWGFWFRAMHAPPSLLWASTQE